MTLSKPFVSLALTAGFIACSFAQIAAIKGGYTFHVKYTPGQVIEFNTSTTAGNKGSSAAGFHVDVPITIHVLSVDKKKGIAKTNLTIGAGVFNKKPVTAAHTMQLDLDSNDASAYGGLKGPGKPLQIGGTWKAMRPVSLGGGSAMPLNGIYHFQGIKKVDGKQMAVVTYDVSGAANGRGTMLLLASDGTLYSNDMRLTVAGAAVSQLHVVMSRISEKKIAAKPHK